MGASVVYNDVLAPICTNGATTVAKVIEAGKATGFEPTACQDHLQWLYTGGGHLSVDGLQYPAMPEQVDQKGNAA
jgi:hypothetical protein